MRRCVLLFTLVVGMATPAAAAPFEPASLLVALSAVDPTVFQDQIVLVNGTFTLAPTATNPVTLTSIEHFITASDITGPTYYFPSAVAGAVAGVTLAPGESRTLPLLSLLPVGDPLHGLTLPPPGPRTLFDVFFLRLSSGDAVGREVPLSFTVLPGTTAANVPEPGTLGLVGVGLGFALGRRRCRAQSA
jgi:hypothetical protein